MPADAPRTSRVDFQQALPIQYVHEYGCHAGYQPINIFVVLAGIWMPCLIGVLVGKFHKHLPHSDDCFPGRCIRKHVGFVQREARLVSFTFCRYAHSHVYSPQDILV